jgi:hypothetical protein
MGLLERDAVFKRPVPVVVIAPVITLVAKSNVAPLAIFNIPPDAKPIVPVAVTVAEVLEMVRLLKLKAELPPTDCAIFPLKLINFIMEMATAYSTPLKKIIGRQLCH